MDNDDYKYDLDKFNVQYIVYANCPVCNSFQEKIVGEKAKVCDPCIESAKVQSAEMGVSVEDYIDGLIVSKKMSEVNMLDGHKVNLSVKKKKK
ncbi:hypothetical protein D3C87_75830 [compost metagenome]